MIFGSVCSGISCESVAWRPLNWSPAWFAEIAPFPSAVLSHHYPDTPNFGDVNKIHEKESSRKAKSTSSSAARRAKNFPFKGRERAPLTQAAGSPSGSLRSRKCGVHGGSSGRTSKPSCPQMEERILMPSSGRWERSGTGILGTCWTREISAFPKAAAVLPYRTCCGDWQRAAAVFSEHGSLPGTAEPDRIVTARGRRTRAEGAGAVSEAYAIQVNDIHRCGEAGGTQGIALREGLMYCLTVSDKHAVIADGTARYILPVEAERLQGLPDDYTKVPYRGKPAEQCPDQLRYEAVGNAVPVPILRSARREAGVRGFAAEGLSRTSSQPRTSRRRCRTRSW